MVEASPFYRFANRIMKFIPIYSPKKCKNRVLGCKNMGINDSVFE